MRSRFSLAFGLVIVLFFALVPAVAKPRPGMVRPVPTAALEAGAGLWLDDGSMEIALAARLRARGYGRLLDSGRLAVSVADLGSPATRYAGLNDERMFYAASLPKVAILLGAFDAIERGRLRSTPALREQLTAMIRVSSNRAATQVLHRVGFENIARVLRAPSVALYEPGLGGLWVGKAYGEAEYWRRDPVGNLSHGATAMHAARFFVLLAQGDLVSPEASAEMKEILGDPGIHHKFVRGLDRRPGARIYRKSGSWHEFHADAALVERDDSTYVAAALVESDDGGKVLEEVIVAIDDIIRRTPKRGT